jgi:hypothetical protein
MQQDTVFPFTPSEVEGYRSLDQNPELPRIRRARRFAWIALILVPLAAAGLVALDIRNDWSSDLNRNLPLGLGLYVLGMIALCGIVGASFQYAFGRWRNEFEQNRRSHQDGNANLVAKRIADLIGAGIGWNWFRPANWGDGYFVTVGNCFVLINLQEDWIRYIMPESIRDIRFESRRVGATSESESHAQTIGGGHYLFTAQTSVRSTGRTVDHYRHVVDIFTSEPGAGHLCADFGADEALAKKAFSCLLPLSGRSSIAQEQTPSP